MCAKNSLRKKQKKYIFLCKFKKNAVNLPPKGTENMPSEKQNLFNTLKNKKL
jgi:hypothetical protein